MKALFLIVMSSVLCAGCKPQNGRGGSGSDDAVNSVTNTSPPSPPNVTFATTNTPPGVGRVDTGGGQTDRKLRNALETNANPNAPVNQPR